jgi:hypothetical protein
MSRKERPGPYREESRPEVDAEKIAAMQAAWGFPSFAQDFPRDAELMELVAAFAAGNYAAVRTGAPALAAKTNHDDVKRAAQLLRKRIEPDPTARVFFGLAALLLVFLFGWWVTHDGPADAKGHVDTGPVKLSH